MMFKNKIILLLILVMLLGFGMVQAESKEITIVFWNGIGAPENVVLTELISKFNETNKDGINVNEIVMDWGTLYSKLLLDYRVGRAPDALIMQQSALAQQAGFGVLAEISELADEVGFKKEDYVERAWGGTLINGKRYAIPLDMHPLALYYNTKLFEEAGLDPDKPPTNREELIDYAQKLTKDIDNDGVTDQYGIGIAYSGGIPFRIWMSLIWQHEGGAILTDDLKKAAFNTQAGIESLQFLQDLVYKYKVIPEEEASPDDDFSKELVAMIITGPWAMFDFSALEDFEYRTAPMPVIYDQPATWGDSHILALADTGNKDKMEASMKLVKFISDQSIIWTVKAGHLPVKREILESDEFKKLELSQAFANSLDFTYYYPSITKKEEVFGREATSPFVMMIESVLLNQETSKKAIEKAEKVVNKILAEE